MTRPGFSAGCLFCGGNASEPNHWARCDGRQGGREEPSPGFSVPGAGPDHDGDTYDPELDHVRLNAQTLRVWSALRSGRSLTLRQIADETGDPEASVSARLRDLRKPKFGGHTVERRRLGDSGLFVYRLIPELVTSR